MDRKAGLPRLLGVVAVIVFLTSFAQPALSDSAPCDPNYVRHYLKVWQVVPTGADDTANLQCAFNQAVKLRGSTVLLGSGTYHTGQVAVIGFVGSFRGAGMDETIIQTLDRPLYVTYLDFFKNLPTPESGSNPWPSIFAFVGGDIVVSDLSLYATENSGTTGWTFSWLGVNVYELAHGIVVVGSEAPGQSYTQADAALYRIRVEGLPRAGTLTGYNVINATYYEGFLGVAILPLRGKFDVHDSHFRQAGGSTNLANLYDSRVSITGNSYTDSFEGMDIGYVSKTSYKFTDNEVFNVSAWGIDFYGTFDTSGLVVTKNTFTGAEGPDFDDSATFSGDTECRLLKNDVENVSGVGIYLGAGTSDCLVVCKEPSDIVKNLGTDNKLVDCREGDHSKTFMKGILPRLPKALEREP